MKMLAHFSKPAALAAGTLVLASVSLAPLSAVAAGVYSIPTGSASVTGQTINVSGTSAGNPQVGANSGQHMAVDWDEDKDGNTATGAGYQEAPAGGLTFTPTFFGGSANNATGFNAVWSGSH